MNSNCSILSDMFSLGMVICAIFNSGKTLIQAQNSTSAYLKQLELVSEATNKQTIKSETSKGRRDSLNKQARFIAQYKS